MAGGLGSVFARNSGSSLHFPDLRLRAFIGTLHNRPALFLAYTHSVFHVPLIRMTCPQDFLKRMRTEIEIEGKRGSPGRIQTCWLPSGCSHDKFKTSTRAIRIIGASELMNVMRCLFDSASSGRSSAAMPNFLLRWPSPLLHSLPTFPCHLQHLQLLLCPSTNLLSSNVLLIY